MYAPFYKHMENFREPQTMLIRELQQIPSSLYLKYLQQLEPFSLILFIQKFANLRKGKKVWE